MTETWTATLALVIWPVLVLTFFTILPPVRATLWTFIGALMFLPVGALIKIPVIPPFDKASLPSMTALVGVLVFGRKPVARTSLGLIEVLISIYLAVPFVSSLLNGDTLVYGETILPGTTAYEGGSAVLAAATTLIPLWLGRRLFRSAEDHLQIFRVLTIAGLGYSLLLLFEVRFSPQLHYWLYGYYPTDFIQSVREGGFRPMAFMGHGLLAALFVCTAGIAASALWRLGWSVHGLPLWGPSIYLAGLLVLCKSAAATVYGATLMPLARFAGPRMQLRIAAILTTICLAYPILRIADLFPTNLIVQTAQAISADRADSMIFRFDNEDRLLARALERPLFGWGRFGRGRTYDADSGRDISVTDGRWIITLGQFGVLGFIAEFGLLTIPIYRAAFSRSFANNPRDRILLASLSLIVAVNIIDLLPNASFTPWLWLLSGALLGRTEALRISSRLQKS